jgi:hypothetical protein
MCGELGHVTDHHAATIPFGHNLTVHPNFALRTVNPPVEGRGVSILDTEDRPPVQSGKSRLGRNRHLKASPNSAIRYIVRGEVQASVKRSEGSRRRRTYIHDVLSSVSEFVSVCGDGGETDWRRRCCRSRVVVCWNVFSPVDRADCRL